MAGFVEGVRAIKRRCSGAAGRVDRRDACVCRVSYRRRTMGGHQGRPCIDRSAGLRSGGYGEALCVSLPPSGRSAAGSSGRPPPQWVLPPRTGSRRSSRPLRSCAGLSEPLGRVCRAFVQFCRQQGLFGAEPVAIVASKFAAPNSPQKAFTTAQIEREAKRLDERMAIIGGLDLPIGRDAGRAWRCRAALEALRVRRPMWRRFWAHGRDGSVRSRSAPGLAADRAEGVSVVGYNLRSRWTIATGRCASEGHRATTSPCCGRARRAARLHTLHAWRFQLDRWRAITHFKTLSPYSCRIRVDRYRVTSSKSQFVRRPAATAARRARSCGSAVHRTRPATMWG